MTKGFGRRLRTLQAAVALAVAAAAIEASAAPSGEEDLGRELYLKYCSACHGTGAKGDGVVSGLLRPPPPDLTQIAKKANGKFPFYDVIRQIDGRETVRAHGDSAMPVWGVVFQSEEGNSPGAENVARGKAVLITDYLERIQQK